MCHYKFQKFYLEKAIKHFRAVSIFNYFLNNDNTTTNNNTSIVSSILYDFILQLLTVKTNSQVKVIDIILFHLTF